MDIGANIGYFTLLASRKVGPEGRVISVEAAPPTFRRLSDNIEINDCGNVRALNVAATREPCKVRIEHHEARNSGMNSIAEDNVGGTVDGWTFEQIAGEELGNISFIKIDIEGSEAPVLEAILRLSGRARNELIIAAEISESSAHLVKKFIDSGFQAYSISNIYTIDYYLIRKYLSRYGEFSRVVLSPIYGYVAGHNDYVLVRGPENIRRIGAIGLG